MHVGTGYPGNASIYKTVSSVKNFTEPLNLDIVGRHRSGFPVWGREPLNGNRETRAAVHSCAEWVLHSFRDTTYRERCSLELCRVARASVPPETVELLRGMGLALLPTWDIPHQDYPESLSLSPSAQPQLKVHCGAPADGSQA